MPKQKQIDKARETLDIYAPIAHRLGIHAIKWELEDLAFQTLHPRKYNEIKGLVAQQRAERERYVNQAGDYLSKELDELGIEAEISGRAKHFYSIYSKMTKKGREFNEIYDLTAMRVIVGSVKDCYGAVGVIHSLWKPLPGPLQGLHRDAQVQHVPVAAHDGDRARGHGRSRSRSAPARCTTWPSSGSPRTGCTRRAQPGAGAAGGPADPDGKLKWLRSLLDWQKDLSDPREFMETLKVDLFEDEVFVFTPKGEVKSLAAGATPLDFAYEIHTDVGHRCVGAKVNGKIVPLSYQLRSGDIVEVLTSKRERGPSRDWLALVKTTRARNKIKAWFKAESRKDTEHTGRELLQEHLQEAGSAGPEDGRLAAAGRRDPRDGLPQGRRLLHRAGRRRRSRRRSSSTRSCSGSSRARPRSPSRPPPTTCSRPAGAARARRPRRRATASPSTASTR